jgi:CDP-2,3-bis-(O-geranylgeranyl)-sn-glycerol synthase
VNLATIAQSVALLTLANTAPLIAKKVLGKLCARSLDGGVKFLDGKALFGPSKTIRGVVLSVLVTAAAAPLFGVAPGLGALVAATAMLGDLLSSFVKRRLGLPPSSRAIGLDQVPESVFPLLAWRHALLLDWADIVVAVAIFFVGQTFFARLFYWLRLRDEPY